MNFAALAALYFVAVALALSWTLSMIALERVPSLCPRIFLCLNLMRRLLIFKICRRLSNASWHWAVRNFSSIVGRSCAKTCCLNSLGTWEGSPRSTSSGQAAGNEGDTIVPMNIGLILQESRHIKWLKLLPNADSS